MADTVNWRPQWRFERSAARKAGGGARAYELTCRVCLARAWTATRNRDRTADIIRDQLAGVMAARCQCQADHEK